MQNKKFISLKNEECDSLVVANNIASGSSCTADLVFINNELFVKKNIKCQKE